MVIDELTKKLQTKTGESFHRCRCELEHEINMILENHAEIVNEIERRLEIEEEC